MTHCVLAVKSTRPAAHQVARIMEGGYYAKEHALADRYAFPLPTITPVVQPQGIGVTSTLCFSSSHVNMPTGDISIYPPKKEGGAFAPPFPLSKDVVLAGLAHSRYAVLLSAEFVLELLGLT